MHKMIWGNILVKNEENYLWFAVKSVIDYLDKILIWDTGSTDQTVEIIKLLQKEYREKIDFREVKITADNSITKVRQQMLDETRSDWFLVIDGDEVWWKQSIKMVVDVINKEGEDLNCLVNPYYNLIGDIYHYQEEEAGSYKIHGKRGHLTIRAINRRIPGLHVDLPYGKEGFFNEMNIAIQNLPMERVKFLNAPYLHFTHLVRSKFDEKVTQRSKKRKYEIGNKFPNDFKFPEVLYEDGPEIVSSPWMEMDLNYKLLALFQTPLKKIKRRITK